MPSQEEIQRRRERNAEWARQRAAKATPTGGLELGRRVVEPVYKKVIEPLLMYPQRAAGEVVQQFGETREAIRDRGVLGGIGHLGRETLSTGLDVAADLTPLPESWGERMDPSGETAMGAEVERAKRQFEAEQGRRPTMTEEYDIMATIQDREMPWLTERQKVGPLEFSNRMWIEAPTEIASAVGETALTLGVASAGKLGGKVLGKVGQHVAAKYGAGEGAKATTARVAGGGLQQVGGAVEKVLMTPKKLDDLFGVMVAKPLGWLWQGGVAKPVLFGVGAVSITKAQLKNTINIFRKRAIEEGAPVMEVNKKAQDFSRSVIDQNKVENMKPGQQLRLFDDEIDTAAGQAKLMSEEPDLSVGTGGRPDAMESLALRTASLTRLAEKYPLRSASDPAIIPQDILGNMYNDVDAIARSAQEGMGIDEWSKLSPEAKVSEVMDGVGDINPRDGLEVNYDIDPGKFDVHDIMDDIVHDVLDTPQFKAPRTPVGPEVVPQDRGGFHHPVHMLSVDFASTYTERGRDIVRGLWDDYILPLENKLKSNIPESWGKAPVVGGLFRKPTRVITRAETPEGQAAARSGRDVERKLNDFSDKADEATEAMANNARGDIAFMLAKMVDQGVIRFNSGTAKVMNAAHDADDAAEIITASGSLIEDILEGAGREGQGNYVFSDAVLEGSGMTFRGNTLVSEGYQGVRSKNARGETVDANLLPGFGDVAERLPLYEQQLKSVKVQIGQEVRDAYSLMQDITEYTARMENTLVDMGVNMRGPLPKVAGKAQQGVARGVMYGEGAHYFPRNASGAVEINPATGKAELVLNEKQAPTELTFNPEGGGRWGVPAIKGRVALSQAEGMTRGEWYAHPADAVADYIKFVGDKKRNDAIGDFIVRYSQANKVESGTVKQLLKNSDEFQKFEMNLEKVRNKIRNIKNRQKRATGMGQTRLIISADDVMKDMRKELRLTPLTKFQGTAEGVEEYFQYMDKKFAEWHKKVKSLGGRQSKNKEEMEQVLKLLDKAKANYDIAKKDLLRGKATMSGMGLGLEGVYFPHAFRDAILNASAAAEKRRQLPGGGLVAINSLLRMYGATGDMSAIGIQGSAALINEAAMGTRATRLVPGIGQLGKDVRGTQELKINRQGDSWKAFKSSLQAWTDKGPDIVGEYFYIARRTAINNGTLTPDEWASAGLGILANAPDFYVSRNRHILTKFDRMFTQYGNVLRHGLADAELQLLMAQTGKTARQLLDSGDAARIAGFTNVFTGVGQRRWGGNSAQFLLFAPRFFHARMKVASDALKGVLPGTNKTLERRIAAKHMTRYMGFASFLTFGINELNGEETDINPLIQNPSTGKWHFNPNFMRIHAGSLDVSLFGPFDSLLRIFSSLPLMALNRKHGGEILRDLRSNVSAPVSSLGLDIITGYNSIGERTRPQDEGFIEGVFSPEMMNTLLEHALPFSWNDVFLADPGKQTLGGRFSEGFREIGEGDIKEGVTETVTAAAQFGFGILGTKSAYESVSETLNKAYADILELGPDDPRLQEAFGVTGKSDARMTQGELNEIWASMGKDWWHKIVNVDDGFDISLSFAAIGSEKTPTWDQVASDIRKNIQRSVREGKFTEIMTAEELITLENRVKERMEQSATEYSRYAVERDEIIADGFTKLQKAEADFLESGAKDLGKFMKGMSDIRKATASTLRALTGPHGTFEDIGEELFKFSRDTALGNLSTFDRDVFDSAQSWYYTLLYPGKDEKGPDGKLLRGPDNKPLTTIVTDGGSVDWDLREQRLEMWEDVMKKQFPALSDTKIKSYRRRLEEHQKRESPPITGMILDLQDAIAESGYYDVRKKGVESWLSRYAPGTTAQGMEIYKEWDASDATMRATLENKHRWLGNLRSAMDVWRGPFFRKQPHIDAMLMVLSTRNTQPKTPAGQTVWYIMERNRRNVKPIKDWTGFLSAVRNIEVDPEAIKRYQ